MTELCTAIIAEQDVHKMTELLHKLNILLGTKQDRLERKQEKAS
ncbi:MAG: hypothetical protein JWO91_550 [Acidobacteriaceae bacterium]|nr:hypothetical protein [Acidobacteriaceae bacterium]